MVFAYFSESNPSASSSLNTVTLDAQPPINITATNNVNVVGTNEHRESIQKSRKMLRQT